MHDRCTNAPLFLYRQDVTEKHYNRERHENAMTLFLIALFLVLPIVEVYVLIAAGGAFGIVPVLSACVITAVAGGVILRIQGLSALQNLQKDFSAGKPPVQPAVDGLFLAISAPFLMTPGFVTDVFGFLLLTPPVRHALARYVIRRFKEKMEKGEGVITIRRL